MSNQPGHYVGNDPNITRHKSNMVQQVPSSKRPLRARARTKSSKETGAPLAPSACLAAVSSPRPGQPFTLKSSRFDFIRQEEAKPHNKRKLLPLARPRPLRVLYISSLTPQSPNYQAEHAGQGRPVLAIERVRLCGFDDDWSAHE